MHYEVLCKDQLEECIVEGINNRHGGNSPPVRASPGKQKLLYYLFQDNIYTLEDLHYVVLMLVNLHYTLRSGVLFIYLKGVKNIYKIVYNMEELNIVELIERNPITRLTDTYNVKLLEKIKCIFTDFERQLFLTSFYCYLNYDKTKDFVVDLDNVWKWLGFTQKVSALPKCKTKKK
jgi:hypothetical protein